MKILKLSIFLSALLSFCCILTAGAQKLEIESFGVAGSDISARAYAKKDLNGNNCALIKVSLPLQGVKFEGGVLHSEYKTGEYWVYMGERNRQLQIKHDNFHPLMVTFADYGIERVESSTTYKLVVLLPQATAVNQAKDLGGNFYAISVSPKNAVISIDGIQQPVSSDGEYAAMLPYGEHSYKVEAGGYVSKSGTFNISKDDTPPIKVDLVSSMASVTITCPTISAQIYVDKKLMGIGGTWKGSLKEGMHLIEAKEDGYRSTQKTIQLAQQETHVVNLDPLTPIQGNISVNYKPLGSDIYLDGKKIGQSPKVISGILIGNHKLEIQHAGYKSSSVNINVLEDQTINATGSLVENERVQNVATSNPISSPVQSSASNNKINDKAESSTSDDKIYDVVEKMAQFPGGNTALSNYISTHLKYPTRCQEEGIQGRVLVKFVVEKDGRIGNVEIMMSPDDDLSKEAIRLVKSMPKWSPAQHGGSIVRQWYTLPVTFRLQ